MFLIKNTVGDMTFLLAGLQQVFSSILEYLGTEWVRISFYMLLKFFIILKIIEYKTSTRSKNTILDERTHQLVDEHSGIFTKTHNIGSLEGFSNGNKDVIFQGHSGPIYDNMRDTPITSHLPPSDLYLFNQADCKPENCPSTYSSSCGCIKLPDDKKKLLNTRGNNSRTKECSKDYSRDIYEGFSSTDCDCKNMTVCCHILTVEIHHLRIFVLGQMG